MSKSVTASHCSFADITERFEQRASSFTLEIILAATWSSDPPCDYPNVFLVNTFTHLHPNLSRTTRPSTLITVATCTHISTELVSFVFLNPPKTWIYTERHLQDLCC